MIRLLLIELGTLLDVASVNMLISRAHGLKNKQHEHHPIYDITSFPSIKLPDVVNPEKALLPQPIWMKKGQKIISDLTDKPTEEEMKSNSYHDSSKDDSSEDHSLNSLRLDSRLIKLLKSEGYESYFPVQKNVIPAVVRGIIQKRDIAVCAPTGSGKTLSYVLPICHVCLCLYIIILEMIIKRSREGI